MPTAVAIQCVEVTTPNVPSISGRVVKGLGLILEEPAGMRRTSSYCGRTVKAWMAGTSPAMT